MSLEALQARLQVLEQQILRLAQLAAQEKETEQEDRFWQLAQDLQDEARQVRSEIARMVASASVREGHDVSACLGRPRAKRDGAKECEFSAQNYSCRPAAKLSAWFSTGW